MPDFDTVNQLLFVVTLFLYSPVVNWFTKSIFHNRAFFEYMTDIQGLVRDEKYSLRQSSRKSREIFSHTNKSRFTVCCALIIEHC